MPTLERHARHLLQVCIAFALLARTDGYAQQQTQSSQPRPRVPFRLPGDLAARDSVFRTSALRGRALLLATRDSLPSHVGNSLRCASCHLGNGLQKDGLTWVGSYARFPQFRPRSGKVDLLEDRINYCFQRSMNGSALNPAGRDMRDIVAYLAFLSEGFPVGGEMEGQGLKRLQPLPGDLGRGVMTYASVCARCHGARGQGTMLAPPLWGSKSYNTGAGMANVVTLASFVYALMPIDHAQRLTPQQAFDVAQYINTRPRPDFAGKKHDYPLGNKPPGADYHVLPEPSTSARPAHPARNP